MRAAHEHRDHRNALRQGDLEFAPDVVIRIIDPSVSCRSARRGPAVADDGEHDVRRRQLRLHPRSKLNPVWDLLVSDHLPARPFGEGVAQSPHVPRSVPRPVADEDASHEYAANAPPPLPSIADLPVADQAYGGTALGLDSMDGPE